MYGEVEYYMQQRSSARFKAWTLQVCILSSIGHQGAHLLAFFNTNLFVSSGSAPTRVSEDVNKMMP